MTIYKKKFHGTNFFETLQNIAKGVGKSNLNVNSIRPAVLYRLERWSNAFGDVIAMVFFLKRCNIGGFWTHNSITTDAIIWISPSLTMFLNVLFLHNFWLVFMISQGILKVWDRCF